MKIIIFAGGTGKRFWPLSRKKSPKQFLPIIDHKPMLQMKYDYLRLGFAPEDIYVSTGIQYEQEVASILPELPPDHFIFEPSMRDTGPAVVYATAYVHRRHPDEVVSIQWSDHYIQEPNIFIEALNEAERIVQETGKTVNIAEPARFPSELLGYIKIGKKIQAISQSNLVLCEFEQFVEKPTQAVAKEYLQSGDYAWNLGYFVTTPSTIFNKYQLFAPQMYDYILRLQNNNFDQATIEMYRELPKTAFDYIFAENLNPDEAYVLKTKMGWSDLGAWNQLKEALQTTIQANVTKGNQIDLNSKNCLIYNFDDQKLVTTLNLRDLIVVNTKDVIAIFPQEDNGKIKKLLELVEAHSEDQFT